jgi:plasmid maintenance system antidote protein VapI
MPMRNQITPTTLSELIRSALLEANSLREVERETGVKHQSISMFLRGKTSLRLDLADKLCAYFGIEHVRVKKED